MLSPKEIIIVHLVRQTLLANSIACKTIRLSIYISSTKIELETPKPQYGKEIEQVDHKIWKDEKKRFDNLIEVLRPKIYIADSSNFKRVNQSMKEVVQRFGKCR